MKNYSQKKIYFLNIAIFVLVFVLLLGGLEVVLRVRGKTSDNFLKQDPVLGWVHLADKTGHSVTGEYNVIAHLNHYGLVGPEVTPEKPKDVFRIAVLGDSVTEAFQIEPEVSYARLLESNFLTPGVRKLEVLNFGVTSYGTVKEEYVLENSVLKFKPDMVILGFFTGNDFSDNLNENINPSASFSFYQKLNNSWKLFLRNHSAVYRFFLEKKARNKILRSLQGSSLQACKDDPCKAGLEISDEALKRTENYLEKFKKLADDKKIRFVVLVLPSKNQINAPSNSNSVIDTFLSGKRIDYLDLLPAFQSWAKINSGALTYFPLDGHPNANGHKIIADALIQYLKSHGK